MTHHFPRQIVGVYLDHHSARIIDPRTISSHEITSTFETRNREKGQFATGTHLGNYRSSNNEATEHHQEQSDTRAYFKNIGKHVELYDEILLFGPTTAKDELQHFLLHDPHFRGKIVSVEHSDYITVNQQNALVKNHFKSRI